MNELYEHRLDSQDLRADLYNQRYFKLRLEEELSRPARFKRRLAVVSIDIDHFKWVNDQLGHAIGDEVLKGTAALIRENLRASDIAARNGGEEFSIIMPETTGEGAKNVAEKLRTAFISIFKEYRNDRLPLTISLGVADFPSSADNAQDLVIAADSALYHSKKNGRNRMTFFNESESKLRFDHA